MYAGRGSSHSWTWLADLFESKDAWDTRFADERSLVDDLEGGASVVIVSGGDGFEMASALAPRGFHAIEEHVRAGGAYVGVCAGAYLPLPSRLEPFDRFNLCATRVKNLTPGRDASVESSPRTGVRYGSCSIVHPVRGEVELSDGSSAFTAPIYGGPVFREPESDRVLLRYSSFTHKTTFQIGNEAAAEMVLGAPAVISAKVGDGVLVLAGPHLEHPGYHGANEVFMRLAQVRAGAEARPATAAAREAVVHVLKPLSDLKVSVLGMERETFLVGAKLWDAGRMLELVRAIERRAGSVDNDTAQTVASLLEDAREDMQSLGPERVESSDSAPSKLVEAARLVVDSHFRTMKE